VAKHGHSTSIIGVCILNLIEHSSIPRRHFVVDRAGLRTLGSFLASCRGVACRATHLAKVVPRGSRPASQQALHARRRYRLKDTGVEERRAGPAGLIRGTMSRPELCLLSGPFPPASSLADRMPQVIIHFLDQLHCMDACTHPPFGTFLNTPIQLDD
jgi:hypothetical protein